MAIEDWYFTHQGKISLKQFLCSDKALKGESDKCLDERFPSMLPEEIKPKAQKKKKKKGKSEEKQPKDDIDESDLEPMFVNVKEEL